MIPNERWLTRNKKDLAYTNDKNVFNMPSKVGEKRCQIEILEWGTVFCDTCEWAKEMLWGLIFVYMDSVENSFSKYLSGVMRVSEPKRGR